MRYLIPLASVALVAAAPLPPDPTLQQLLAGARAAPTKGFAFERTQRIETSGSPARVVVDRYNPALVEAWRLVSIDGHLPTPDEVKAWRATTRNGAPSYARVALLLPFAKRVDATHYRVEPLPKGFIKPDLFANNLAAELIVDTSGPKPWVRESHFFAPKPFSAMLIIKIDKFDGVSRYTMAPDGTPRVSEQNVSVSGSGPRMKNLDTQATFKPLG